MKHLKIIRSHLEQNSCLNCNVIISFVFRNQQVKFYISRKIHEDPKWKNVKIIFSGSDVPGEGEHKILEFIRNTMTEASFDPLWTHMIYGAGISFNYDSFRCRPHNVRPPNIAQKHIHCKGDNENNSGGVFSNLEISYRDWFPIN